MIFIPQSECTYFLPTWPLQGHCLQAEGNLELLCAGIVSNGVKQALRFR